MLGAFELAAAQLGAGAGAAARSNGPLITPPTAVAIVAPSTDARIGPTLG